MGREVDSKRCTMSTCVHRDPPGILSEHHKSALVVGQGRALIKVCVRAHRRSADSVSDERQLTKLPREVQKRRSRGNWELLFFMVTPGTSRSFCVQNFSPDGVASVGRSYPFTALGSPLPMDL